VEITDAEHSGEQTQTMDVTKEITTHRLEMKDAEHSGKHTQTMDVTEEAITHTLWRSKMQTTMVSKLRPWV
jgi:hypothetical protein